MTAKQSHILRMKFPCQKVFLAGFMALAALIPNLSAQLSDEDVDKLLFSKKASVFVDARTNEITFGPSVSEMDRQEITRMVNFEKEEKLPPLIFIKQLRLVDSLLKMLSNSKDNNSKLDGFFSKPAFSKEELLDRRIELKTKLREFFKLNPNYTTEHPSFDRETIKKLIDED